MSDMLDDQEEEDKEDGELVQANDIVHWRVASGTLLINNLRDNAESGGCAHDEPDMDNAKAPATRWSRAFRKRPAQCELQASASGTR